MPLTWLDDTLKVPCFQPNGYPHVHPPVLSGPRPQHLFPSRIARAARSVELDVMPDVAFVHPL